MRAVWSIMRREILAYFVSPIAYAFLVIFLLIVGTSFLVALNTYIRIPTTFMENLNLNLQKFFFGGARGLGLWAQAAMLISLPGLSMRLLSEERKSGTSELLFTSPLTTVQIVLGKYFGTLVVLLLLLVLTTPTLAILGWKASPDWPAVAVAYLGLFLFGAVVLAVGLFASALTENQFIALLLTYLMVIPLYIVEPLIGFLGSPLDQIFLALSVTFGLRMACFGSLDSHYLVLCGVSIASLLFLSGRVLDSARWR